MKLALAGDTMLGRGVATVLGAGSASLFAPEVVEVLRDADLVLLNLECCISERGQPVPGRVFHFRAPPAAAEALAELGTSCVTLANNHALDYGHDALSDTFEHLRAAGIGWVGAGPDETAARAPLVLEAAGVRVGVIAAADHPAEYRAGPGRPGIAYADLGSGATPEWLVPSVEADLILVSPHWGPNMTREPVPHVLRAAADLVRAGATLVAGHSAHVPHGVAGRVLYDLGDFVDDYAVDPVMRNDLGLLWLVEVEGVRPVRIEAIPLKLGHCRTELAAGEDALWLRRRFRAACAALGTDLTEADGRLAVALPI